MPIKDRSINPAQEKAGGEGWLLNQFKSDASSDHGQWLSVRTYSWISPHSISDVDGRPFDCHGEWIAMHWSDWRVQAAESRKQNISIHFLIEFFLEKVKSWIQEDYPQAWIALICIAKDL